MLWKGWIVVKVSHYDEEWCEPLNRGPIFKFRLPPLPLLHKIVFWIFQHSNIFVTISLRSHLQDHWKFPCLLTKSPAPPTPPRQCGKRYIPRTMRLVNLRIAAILWHISHAMDVISQDTQRWHEAPKCLSLFTILAIPQKISSAVPLLKSCTDTQSRTTSLLSCMWLLLRIDPFSVRENHR